MSKISFKFPRGQWVNAGCNKTSQSFIQCWATASTNAGLLSTEPFVTKFHQILINIQWISQKKINLKMTSAKWWPFYLCLNVWTQPIEFKGNLIQLSQNWIIWVHLSQYRALTLKCGVVSEQWPWHLILVWSNDLDTQYWFKRWAQTDWTNSGTTYVRTSATEASISGRDK